MRALALSDAYKEDFLLLVTESLIKVVESRIDHKPALVQQAFAEGYILAPYFAEALPVYEKQESSMFLYYKEMIQAIDVVKEDRRMTGVEFNKTSAERPVVKSAPAPPPEATGAEKTLQEAEATYSSRELAKSKALFLKVLEQTEKKSVHASAYYGLARIALIEKDLDSAERLFQKSLDSEPETFDKAWDLVYLGRLAIGAGDRDRAIQCFESVLKLEGATEKARTEAKSGLELTKKP